MRKNLVLFTALSIMSCPSAFGQDGEPGVSGGSGGSVGGFEGMPDTEAVYKADVLKNAKKGKTSKEYIGSLLALGMHYNRSNRSADASKTMKQALQIIDAGALKPAPNAVRPPETTIETQHGDGTVSAQVVRKSFPYEEMLQELLPQLISAELACNELTIAETHIKRLIALHGPNQVADKLSLMSAYASYAELMRKRNRPKEAEMYQRKVDEINSSFIPM
jgi:hypothetical protein